MTNILFWVFYVVAVILVFLLPLAFGLVLRLILKRANGRLIAVLVGAIFLLVNSKITPSSELDAIVTKAVHGMAMEIDLFLRVFNTIIWALVSFGIPYLLARQGVVIGQNRIDRRNPHRLP